MFNFAAKYTYQRKKIMTWLYFPAFCDFLFFTMIFFSELEKKLN